MTQSIEQQAEERYPYIEHKSKISTLVRNQEQVRLRAAFIAGYQQALDSAPRWERGSEQHPIPSSPIVICRLFRSKLPVLDGSRWADPSGIEYLYEPKTETDGK